MVQNSLKLSFLRFPYDNANTFTLEKRMSNLNIQICREMQMIVETLLKKTTFHYLQQISTDIHPSSKPLCSVLPLPYKSGCQAIQAPLPYHNRLHSILTTLLYNTWCFHDLFIESIFTLSFVTYWVTARQFAKDKNIHNIIIKTHIVSYNAAKMY